MILRLNSKINTHETIHSNISTGLMLIESMIITNFIENNGAIARNILLSSKIDLKLVTY